MPQDPPTSEQLEALRQGAAVAALGALASLFPPDRAAKYAWEYADALADHWVSVTGGPAAAALRFRSADSAPR